MERNDKIFIAGAAGQLGRAICKALKEFGYQNILTPNSAELDLCDEKQVEEFFSREKPSYVFFCAAFIGGIEFKRKHPAEIFTQNMKMTLNIFELARKYCVKRMIYLATALVYPNDAEIPTPEACIRQVSPEGADSPYTLLKFSGLKMCEYYRQQYGCEFFTVIPCNFFGPNAPFDGDKAGVIPSLIRRIYKAKTEGEPNVVVWGTGNAGRDFLGVNDVADACIHTMRFYEGSLVYNIGSGNEITIREAAETIKNLIGYEGELIFDKDKPEGRKHMLLDTSLLLKNGWKPKHSFKESVEITLEWYKRSLVI